MTGRHWTVLLTATDDPIRATTVHPTAPVWTAAARTIGCQYIEQVRPLGLALSPYLLLVDEEGLFKRNPQMNPLASWLYGTQHHRAAIVGPAVVVTETDDGSDHAWLTKSEAETLAEHLVRALTRGLGL